MIAVWAVFWLAWGALHWFIVPRISEFRPQLEARASAILGVQVRIDAIAAQSNGMIPSFELAGVRLFDAQGRESLHLPRVLAALSPRSLWNLGFEQLYIDRPELNIRRAVDGRIYVAGLDFSAGQGTDGGAADWLFSQAEFVIHEGTVQWNDEKRALPTLALQQVNLVLRNGLRQHSARLDATPPPQWGERFSLRALLRQPLLSTHSGQWRHWDGQLYAMFEHVDLSELRRYADLGVGLAQGRGAVRAWVDVQRGQVLGATADVALESVDVTLGADLQPMALQSVSGRLGGRLLAHGFEFSTEALQFQTGEGLRWPGGNVRVQHQSAQGRTAAKGELSADRLDLAALSQIANRLPFESEFRRQLQTLVPKGMVERLRVSWQGTAQAITKYEAKGRVVQFELASRPAPPVPSKAAASAAAAAPVGIPGISGLSADFDFNQAGGRASVVVQDGAIDLPGVFEDPVVRVAQLASDVTWQVTDERIAVQAPNLKFRNSDAQGEAQIKWETADPRRSGARSRWPGVLDLQASLSRADGSKVHRYLPLVIPASARHYVRDAIVSAAATGVRFKVKGDLHDMPFKDPRQGEFRISANIQNATFAYLPSSLQAPDSLPWPALTNMSGELVVERARLQINQARAQLGGRAALQVTKAQGLIAALDHDNPRVVVEVDAQGPLGDMLGFVNESPVASMIGQALDQAVGSGRADLRLKLNLPLAAIEESTVQGSVTLHDNDLQFSPDSPRLSKARGVVSFSESGFNLNTAQARMLGGEMRLEGGTVSQGGGNAVGGATSAPLVVLRAQGGVTAEGLRQAKELGFVSRLAQHASGSSTYSATLTFRRGLPELKVLTNLQGMAWSLPAPMSKTAQAVLPIKFENALLRESLQFGPGDPPPLRDQMSLEVGRIGSVVYVREHALAQSRVLRGAIGVGLSPDESVSLPDEGVVANVNLSGVDLDAWMGVLSQAAGIDLTPVAAPGAPGARAGVAAPAPHGGSEALGYLPTTMAIRANELTLGERKLHNVVVGGSREGLLWRANLDAVELNGYVEYRQSSDAGAGRLFARLARLKIAPSTALEVETLLDEQPATIPALDIVVDDFELRGKRLGRVEIDAVNRGAVLATRDAGAREWRLNKFNVVTPEASLSATGNWTSINAQTAAAAGAPLPRSHGERRRTVLNFKLDIADSGELLTRLGMKDAIRRGKGKMEGQVAWIGSPITVDYASMSGAFAVNVENGQFLKQDPGLAKLLGVLSLQSLPRRLVLDFRDVFSEGFAFDFFRGDVVIEQGIAKTNNLQMKGVNAAVLMDGRADIAKETQDIRVVVVPEVNAGTASLIATAINPAIGLGTFLAQMFLRKPLIEAATQEFHVDGSWADPRITKVNRRAGAGNPQPGPIESKSSEAGK
ncbi:YhdP family protein [Rhodoferax sp.]|uniref:YhdP family protein n=1 Tax=Rhodoferax sp. TaxID=50421 RepID=UPI002770128C|nr:YhdP family protein [Rhodoferax sp.]